METRKLPLALVQFLSLLPIAVWLYRLVTAQPRPVIEEQIVGGRVVSMADSRNGGQGRRARTLFPACRHGRLQ
jgi:hypothetical protein